MIAKTTGEPLERVNNRWAQRKPTKNLELRTTNRYMTLQSAKP